MSPIRVETGPMFSRKSTALVAQYERYTLAEKKQGQEFLVFNHANDERYGSKVVATHNNQQVEADASVANAQQLLEYICHWHQGDLRLKPEFSRLEAVLIDEAQFFDELLPDVVEYLERHLGVDIYLYGLDTDFRGEGFGPMPELLARADIVEKHTAICTARINGKRCGKPATQTQRLVDGQPAKYDDPIIMVGAKEAYTARCKHHHEIDRPVPELKDEV